MKMSRLLTATAAIAAATLAPADAAGHDGGPTGAFSYSTDAATAAVQKAAKSVVEKYQEGLDASDFARIRPLFAPNAVSEWNNKTTVIGVDALQKPYEALFKESKFSTDFQYDAVDVYGGTAIVRTHHPVGQTELSLKNGAKTPDFNREIFVLHKFGDAWKIILYTFTTQPRQGEQ